MNFTYEHFTHAINKIATEIEQDGVKYQYICGIARGGLVAAVALSHRLMIPLLTIDWQTRDGSPDTAMIPPMTEAKLLLNNVLYVDDIIDSGTTINTISKWLKHDPDFAVLVYNTRQPDRPAYYGTTIDRAVDQDWINFFWETI